VQHITADRDWLIETATITRQRQDHLVLFDRVGSDQCCIHFYGQKITYQ
jgi:hypothetical protein